MTTDIPSRYTVNGAVSGFGPLIVSTFGYDLHISALPLTFSATAQLTLSQLHDPRIHPAPIPTRGHRLHLHPSNRLPVVSHPKHSYYSPDTLLPSRHSRLCHDLEKLMVSSCPNACSWLHHHWLLWTCGELDHQSGDGKCGRRDEEERHCCSHFRCLLCWECKCKQSDNLPEAYSR